MKKKRDPNWDEDMPKGPLREIPDFLPPPDQLTLSTWGDKNNPDGGCWWLFTQAVKSVLPRMRFSPAQIGGKPVNQLVQQSFQFAVPR